jgi:hypothetical protein
MYFWAIAAEMASNAGCGFYDADGMDEKAIKLFRADPKLVEDCVRAQMIKAAWISARGAGQETGTPLEGYSRSRSFFRGEMEGT